MASRIWLLLVVAVAAANNFYEFPGPIVKPVYQIPFENFGDLINHSQNCSLAVSKYFMTIGCADGWTAMQTTSAFLDSRNSKQAVKFQE